MTIWKLIYNIQKIAYNSKGEMNVECCKRNLIYVKCTDFTLCFEDLL